MSRVGVDRGWLSVVLLGCLIGLAGLFAITHGKPAELAAVALVPPVVWLLTRSYGGLALGVIAVLTVPYWLPIAPLSGSVFRYASLAAAAGLISIRRFRATPIDYWLAALVAIMVLDWLFQYDQPGVWRIVANQVVALGFFLGARALPAHRINLIAAVLLLAGTVGAATLLLEAVHGGPLFVDPNRYAWNPTGSALFRPGGVFGSPPGASAVMCFVIPFGFAWALKLRGAGRVIAGGCLCLCVAAQVLTFTRAGLIGTAAGVIVFLWLIRSPLLRPLPVACYVAIIAAVTVVALPTLERNPTFQEALARPGTLTARVGYWGTALPIATASMHDLLFGRGTGTLEAPSIATASVPSDVAAAPALITNSLHSQYVTTLFEQGLVGVVALLGFLLSTLVASARAARAGRDHLAAALAAGVVGLALVMSVNTVWLHGPSVALLMFAAGLAASADARRRSGVSAAPIAGG